MTEDRKFVRPAKLGFRTARKEYACSKGCGRVIQPGEQYYYQGGMSLCDACKGKVSRVVHAPDGERSTLPPIRALAARVLAGEDLHDIAAQYGFAYSSLTSRFSQAGFASTGESIQQQKRRELQEALARPGKPAWMAAGACLDYHPELWYSDTHNGLALAKEICGECPAKPACLEWAIETDERWGVFGGHTYGERKNLKRREQYEAKKTGTAA